jgi:hypothetical protein
MEYQQNREQHKNNKIQQQQLEKQPPPLPSLATPDAGAKRKRIQPQLLSAAVQPCHNPQPPPSLPQSHSLLRIVVQRVNGAPLTVHQPHAGHVPVA